MDSCILFDSMIMQEHVFFLDSFPLLEVRDWHGGLVGYTEKVVKRNLDKRFKELISKQKKCQTLVNCAFS